MSGASPAGDQDDSTELGELVLNASQALDIVAQVADYAIFALDPQGTIESWNLGAQRTKGYTAEEVLGQRFEIFYGEADRRDGLPQRLLEQAAAQGRVQHTGWRVRKDGSRFWADVILTAVRNRGGRLVGYTKITRDRSDVKALEDARDAFYATFAHDFKTPVVALLGQIDALRDADVGEREALITQAEDNAERLMTMVADLIDFARQRSRPHGLLVGEIDVAALTRQVVRDVPSVHGPERVQVPEDVVALARANGTALHRVLTNVVINALRYSGPETPVVVEVSDLGTDGVEISVRDHGRGIHPDDHDLVFQEFQRGRLAADDGGVGLGLASARELTHQQGGLLRLESAPGEGTTVTVHLEPVPLLLEELDDDDHGEHDGRDGQDGVPGPTRR